MVQRYFKIYLLFLVLLTPLITQTGCKTSSGYLLEADIAARSIIDEKQEQLFGYSDGLKIERPSDILRRRLLIEQDLPYSGNPSFGTDRLEPVAHWPVKDYPKALSSKDDQYIPILQDRILKLSLVQALQVGADNNNEYQTKKEDIFRAALSLDLARDDLGIKLKGEAQSSVIVDKSGGSVTGKTSSAVNADTVKALEHSGSLGISKSLANGMKIASALAVDIVSLLTQGKTSSFGIVGDASITIPLLRGSGRHIVTESMTQAEQDVIYAIYTFERYKKTFAVDITSSYLDVLRQADRVDNALENYLNLMESARRLRKLADAGRATEIDVDQAVQKELSARIRWVSAMESYNSFLDSFKRLLGLPPDSRVEPDRSELNSLTARVRETEPANNESYYGIPGNNQDPVEKKSPDLKGNNDESDAIGLGLDNRLDLLVLEGKIYDAQRKVVVQADALGPELTLLGKASLGQSRSIATAGLEDARIRTEQGIYTGLLTIDLPFERTAERNAFRNSLISLERAVREFQKLEDDIKISIRKRISEMSEAREALSVQSSAVELAEKRVKSTDLFLEAGRVQLRDLLDAQEALLTAKNALTSAVVDYRIAELAFQRDTGVLKIDKSGLIIEDYPREK
ncbi:MAG: TolC family protein [Deltaproteobacteria bacterium]|nr:TolC family protein [Deltaproteobacteria bacterium]